jgi:hypothetical protein
MYSDRMGGCVAELGRSDYPSQMGLGDPGPSTEPISVSIQNKTQKAAGSRRSKGGNGQKRARPALWWVPPRREAWGLLHMSNVQMGGQERPASLVNYRVSSTIVVAHLIPTAVFPRCTDKTSGYEGENSRLRVLFLQLTSL